MFNRIRSQKGFTLIEMVVVLIVVGILVAFAAAKMIPITDETRLAALRAGIVELNSRENLCFAQINLNGVSYATPLDYRLAIQNCVSETTSGDGINTSDSLGAEYSLDVTDPAVGTEGAHAHTWTFQGVDMAVTYNTATSSTPANWTID
jgi:prepilin-type N-terminal cleavage/methylation domain-containing protein